MGKLAYSLFSLLMVGFSPTYAMAAAAATGGGSSVGSAAAAGDKHTSSAKLMGIEIETSAVKILSPDENIIGFYVSTPSNSKWMIEEDTTDSTFASAHPYEKYNRNLELKTLGGFSEAEIVPISGLMHRLLNYLHTHATEHLEVDEKMLSGLLDGSVVEGKKGNPEKVSIKSKTEDCAVRPQITYQIPLHLMPRVFEHLGALGHEKVKDFLDCFNSTIPPELTEEEIAIKLAHHLLLMRNSGHDKNLRLLFKREVAPRLIDLPEGNVKGFSYLFLYYWYTIFNNKENPSETSEPGPKKSLAVLSRVPISQIFDKLDTSEKDAVRSIFDPIVLGGHGDAFRIKNYSNYDEETVKSTTTLKDWYISIIDPESRIEVLKRRVDLLSPPPGLEDVGYSMGALDIDKHSSGYPLIEVRGYATLNYKGVPISIENFAPLIGAEAHWFFNELGG